MSWYSPGLVLLVCLCSFPVSGMAGYLLSSHWLLSFQEHVFGGADIDCRPGASQASTTSKLRLSVPFTCLSCFALFSFNLYFMCMSVLFAWFLCTRCVSDQKRSLKWELWTAVSSHMGAGNWTWVLCQNSKCLQQLSHLSRPVVYIFLYLWVLDVFEFQVYTHFS